MLAGSLANLCQDLPSFVNSYQLRQAFTINNAVNLLGYEQTALHAL